jgi:predicted transcriptional regulator of viral defense system
MPNYAIKQSIISSTVLQCGKIGYNPALVVFQINNNIVDERVFLNSLPIKSDDPQKENCLYKIIARYVLSKLYQNNETKFLQKEADQLGILDGFNSIIHFLNFFERVSQ